MSRTRRLVLVASLVLGSAAVLAQDTQTPIPQGLDEMIASALRSNPEVLLADAKVRQAQAELNQARLKVTRDVVTAFNERKLRVTLRESAGVNLNHAQERVKSGAASQTEFQQARAALGQSELAVAQADAEVRYLIGAGSKLDVSYVRGSSSAEVPKPAIPTRPETIPINVADALERPVTGPFESTNLADLAKRLADQAKISILLDANAEFGEGTEFTMSMPLRDSITLGGVLRAIADQHDLCFVLRDYGILVTRPHRAEDFVAPAIPQNTPLSPGATK
jgi:hypothetical protein